MAPLILMYHSVQKVRTDPWGLRVSPRNFAAHLRTVRERLHPMRLDEMDRMIKAGEPLPENAVVITFDDGYADNLRHAKPILEEHGVPATIFVATATLGTDREYWWDELERLLLLPRRLPRLLQFSIDGQEHMWDLKSDARVSRLSHWRWRNWRAWYPGVPSRRHEVFLELWKRIKRASAAGRQQGMEQLREWAGSASQGRGTHRCVTVQELRQLARGGLIEIGAHTVTHPSLASLQLEAQRQELCESKSRLEHELQTPITSFSYPFGTADDYNADTIQALKSAEIERACTTVAGPVTSSCKAFEYPRRGVMNWGRDEFIERLRLGASTTIAA